AGAQHFVQAFESFASVTIGINADLVAELSSQQTIHWYFKPLAKHIPERGFDAADRVVDNAGNRTGAGSGKLQFAEQAMNVARVLAQQQRLERAQNRSEAGSEEAFTQPSQSFIRFDADECPIEIALDHRGLQPEDLHVVLNFFRAIIRCGLLVRLEVQNEIPCQTWKIGPVHTQPAKRSSSL